MKKNTKITLGILSAFLILGSIGPISALAAGPEPINLLTAGNFVVLSKAGRQVEVIVEVAVPTNTVNGTYTTNYGVESLLEAL
jgi:hypothetical protein